MKNQFNNKFLNHVLKVLEWLIQSSHPELIVILPRLKEVLKSLDLIGKSNGLPYLVSYMKEVRLVYLRYLSGKPVKSKTVRTTSEGIPVILAWVKDYPKLSTNCFVKRLILTLLYSSRSLNLGNSVDLSSIIESPKKLGVLYDQEKVIKLFWKELGYFRPEKVVPSSLRFTRFHLSTKVGPNKGGNALWTSLRDLFSLPEDLINNISIIGGDLLRDRINLLLKSRDILNFLKFDTTPGIFRRLVWFPDKELKVRTIAILDYWSQTSLRQLHSYIFKILKRIPQDMTFNQGAFKDSNLLNSSVFYSVDLSNATDRFPMDLIVSILKGRLPSDYVEAWKSIMISHPFLLEDKMISYAAGNQWVLIHHGLPSAFHIIS